MIKKDKRMKLRPDHKLALEIPSDYNMVEETKKVLLAIKAA